MKTLFRIALAYLRNRARQSIVSVLGVLLGVGFYIGIAAMMQGFQTYFITKIIDVSPHIIIKDEYRTAPTQPAARAYPGAVVEIRGLKPKEELRGIRGAERIIAALKSLEGTSIAPTLSGQVFLRYGGKDLSATMKGIEPVQERNVSNLENDLISGSLNDLIANPNGIILGEGLAKKLAARNGATLSVISPAGVVLKMKVVGIFATGITSLDNATSYALLKRAQILQQRENVINQIRLRITDVDRADAIAADIERRYRYRTEGWQETNSNVFSIFMIQNGVMYSTVGAILIVAGFGIFNIISTVVNEKNRDIAILKSMGFSAQDIQWIFVIQGVIVGLIGAVLGWGLGWLLIEALASVRFELDEESFIRTQGFILHRSIWNYVIAALMAVVSSTVSAFLPARKAASLNPVDIIRGAA